MGDLEEEFEKASIGFLLAELELAMAFMDLADTSRLEDTKTRNYGNARTAYDTVLRLLPKLKSGQQPAVNEKLSLLKDRLGAAGQQF
jgi:hypothetical protein